jgi:trehalose/maltose transport system substrate-binding protein
MAEKIQKGQRAKGNKDFWGYVWQGADSEALTCNAIEWQVTEGGGRIAEDNKTISVNNPAAIRSWQRAKHWIGWISPPSVLAYRELDSTNAFDSGNAAFNRVWGGSTINRGGQSNFVHSRDALVGGRTGYSSIPSGAAASAGSLGGSGLAVAKNSRHPKEAIELVRFLIRAQARVDADMEKAAASQATPPLGFDNVRMPGRPDRGESLSEHSGHIVSRPSSILGAKYEPVARAYMHTVHAVLAGEKNAPQAAAELEKQLVEITGFTVGPPKKAD